MAADESRSAGDKEIGLHDERQLKRTMDDLSRQVAVILNAMQTAQSKPALTFGFSAIINDDSIS
jgi:hypothetical protein